MKKTFVLLVITLAVAAWVYYFEVQPETKLPSTDESETLSKTLLGAAKDAVKGFALAKTGGETISVELVNGEWVMTSPVKASAEEATVNGVLWDLEWTEKEETIPAAEVTPEKLKSYGLDAPVGTIDVTLKDKSERFILGGPNLGGTSIYVRTGNDGPVVLVKKKFADNLDVTAFKMRSKTVVPLVAAQVGYMKMTGKTNASLEKKEGQWNLIEPYEDYADPETVTALIKDANALLVASFVTDEAGKLAEYGLETPAASAVFAEAAATGKSYTINVGKEAPAGEDGKKYVYAAMAGWQAVFTLSAEQIDKLFPTIGQLQAKTLCRFDSYMLKKATFTSGMNEVELAKPDFDWKMVKPMEAEADSSAVGKLLADMLDFQIAQVVTGEPEKDKYGLETPRASFSYVQADKPLLGIIVGADAGEGMVYAKRTDTPAVFRVSTKILDTLATPAIKLHTLDMQRMTIANIETLTITRGEDAYTLKRIDDQTWKMTAPAEADANKSVTAGIAGSLATLRAAEIVEGNPTDAAQYGLDKPAARIDFKMTSEAVKVKPVLVGKASEGGKRYAMLEGEQLVFTINANFARILFEEMKDPAIFAIRPAEATQIEFTAGEKKVLLTRVDNVWQVEAPAGRKVSQSALWTELTHLADLATAKFVSYKTADLGKYGLDKPQAVVRLVMPAGASALSVGTMAESGHYYATSTTTDGIFLLTPGDIAGMLAPEKVLQEETAAPAAEAVPSTGEVVAPQETTEGAPE